MNVDRTPRNPNLLVWHGRPWLIDHGAALYLQHDAAPWRARPPAAAFPRSPTTCCCRSPTSILDADERLAPRSARRARAPVAGAVPDAWLAGPRRTARPLRRVPGRRGWPAPRAFAQEAEDARRAALSPSSTRCCAWSPTSSAARRSTPASSLFCRRHGFLAARVALDRERLRRSRRTPTPTPIAARLDDLARVARRRPAAGPIAALDASERFGWLTAPSSTVVQPSAGPHRAVRRPARDARPAVRQARDHVTSAAGLTQVDLQLAPNEASDLLPLGGRRAARRTRLGRRVPDGARRRPGGEERRAAGPRRRGRGRQGLDHAAAGLLARQRLRQHGGRREPRRPRRARVRRRLALRPQGRPGARGSSVRGALRAGRRRGGDRRRAAGADHRAHRVRPAPGRQRRPGRLRGPAPARTAGARRLRRRRAAPGRRAR